MPLNAQLDALEQIYRVLDDTLDSRDLACHRGCSACCTQNVTMTTLEGYRVLAHLDPAVAGTLFKRLAALKIESRFQLDFTLNEQALQFTGDDSDAEDPDLSDIGICPLLIDDICLIYADRPLACRTMVSTHDCRSTGYAAMDPFLLSVGNVFLQFTEHIDQNGLTGNLIDVLQHLSDLSTRRQYESGKTMEPKSGLPVNHPLSVLMVPPEHRQKISPILKMLNPGIDDIA